MSNKYPQNIIPSLRNRGYFSTPYNRDNKPILSFLICWRVKRALNQGSDLYTFLDSVLKKMMSNTQKEMEFLIKIDLDDDIALKEVFEKDIFNNKYPMLQIRPFVFRRWEARNTLYLNYTFLFSHKNPTIQYITFATDDSLIERDIFFDLEKNMRNTLNAKYSILTAHGHSVSNLQDSAHWRKWTSKYTWAGAGMTDPFPIISSKIIEICGGMGWQSNIDNWITLLNVIMFNKYRITLQHDLRPWIALNLKKVPQIDFQNYPSLFNKEMIISTTKQCENDYYFDLVEQQVKNIYLNMKADGIKFPHES